jgi:hypothetical protein
MPNPRRILLALLTLTAAIAVAPAAALAAPPVEPVPQLSFEPGSYDFGLQQVNSNAAQTNLQLRNAGSEPVRIDSLELSGPGTEAFWIGYSNCWGGTNLQPGETCSVQVYFSPHDTVEYAIQARVNVGSYAFGADLSGSGGRSVFAPSSNPTDFGVSPVGSAGTTREIAVTNVGNLPGGVYIAVISGGAVGSFHLLDENCTNHALAPAATCTLQVRFQPLSEGVKTATLSLFGEQDGGTQMALTGIGAAPDPASAPAAPAPAAVAGSMPSGSSARPRSRHHRKRRSARRHRRHRGAGIDLGRTA